MCIVLQSSPCLLSKNNAVKPQHSTQLFVMTDIFHMVLPVPVNMWPYLMLGQIS